MSTVTLLLIKLLLDCYSQLEVQAKPDQSRIFGVFKYCDRSVLVVQKIFFIIGQHQVRFHSLLDQYLNMAISYGALFIIMI